MQGCIPVRFVGIHKDYVTRFHLDQNLSSGETHISSDKPASHHGETRHAIRIITLISVRMCHPVLIDRDGGKHGVRDTKAGFDGLYESVLGIVHGRAHHFINL